MNKLKIFGLLTGLAGLAVNIVAGVIDDKKMEEAVEKAVDEKLGIKEVDSESVSEVKETDVSDYAVVAEY